MTAIAVPRALIADEARFGGAAFGPDMVQGLPVFKDGKLVALSAAGAAPARIVLPKLTEAHCHLDKCHTIHRLGAVGGDLRTAISAQLADKENWTEEDVRQRAMRGLSEARAAGCGALRTHVDWGNGAAPPLAWDVLNELRADSGIHMQCAALIGIDQLADADFAQSAVQTVAAKDAVLGAFILDHTHTAEGLANVFAAARRHDLLLDFHVDEGLGPLTGLEAIADAALATGHRGPILCGHACALMDQSPAGFDRIAGKLAAANITVCALPTTNLYLQGRTRGTPDRRGITRLQELQRAGVPIAVASDNVADAFCPMGQHDPMAALHLAALAAHLDPPLGRWLPLITTSARTAMGLAPLTVDGALASDLLIADTDDLPGLIAGRARLAPYEGQDQ